MRRPIWRLVYRHTPCRSIASALAALRPRRFRAAPSSGAPSPSLQALSSAEARPPNQSSILMQLNRFVCMPSFMRRPIWRLLYRHTPCRSIASALAALRPRRFRAAPSSGAPSPSPQAPSSAGRRPPNQSPNVRQLNGFARNPLCSMPHATHRNACCMRFFLRRRIWRLQCTQHS